MEYLIQLEQFEGPFDLLLFFIERDELDIHDIPISKVTKDFLEHIKELEELNLNVASEFILVAASLMRIKSKMLLPRKELDEQGNEIDPRADLVQRLIEYKRFKEVIPDFAVLEEQRQRKEYRGNIAKEVKMLTQKSLIDSELESLSLFKVMKAFQDVMEKLHDRNLRAQHEVAAQKYKIEVERVSLRQLIQRHHKASFRQVFEDCETKMQAIVRFLALLEALSARRIAIVLGQGVNNFWLEEKSHSEEE